MPDFSFSRLPARTALAALLGCPLFALAQSVPTSPQPVIEQQRQQERERALREQNERTVDERLPAAPVAAIQRIPNDELPCFVIDRITLVGDQSESFQWALDLLLDMGGIDGDGPLHRCLGTTGVNVVLARAQQALIARGWVTTRVLTAPQDLSTGTLALTLVPGRIAAIRFTTDSVLPSRLAGRAMLASAIPASPGDLLNLRDIEQGLENFKRLPTVEADIQIEPSTAPDARPGDSDLVVKVVQKLPLRVALSLDDSGTKASGRYQTGATVSADNLLGLNDLFYASGGHSLGTQSLDHLFSSPDHATESQTLHYSLPWSYWLLGLTAANSRYRQTVQGLSQNYTYAGKTQNQEVKLSRLIYRDQVRKTTLALKVFRRETSNFIEDTEIENQHRIVGGWEASLNHREFIGEATLDGTLAYKRGTGAFGALPAPEEAFGEGSSRMRLTTAEVSLNTPFSLNLDEGNGVQKLRYSGLFRAQWNATPLTPQDRFAIGGRFSVRGFDGETSLLGDRGWLIRNDVGCAIGQSGAELYAGIDYGHVSGRSTIDTIGTDLAGGVVGVRGAWGSGSRLSYDFFVGAPISKPVGYRSAGVTSGFTLNLSF